MPAVLSRFTTLCDGVVSAMILRRNDREHTNRLVCKQFADVIDAEMKSEVGWEFRRLLNCVDANTAAVALIETQRQRAIAKGAATVLGWRAALDFLWLLRHGLRTGVVAGSAALYVELLATGNVVEWYPNDIDVWMDVHRSKEYFETASGYRPPEGILRLITRLEEDNDDCNSDSVGEFAMDGSDYAGGTYASIDPLIFNVQTRKMTAQVIMQSLPPHSTAFVKYSPVVELVCSCDVYSTCAVCVGPVRYDSEPERFYRNEYIHSWLSGRPHTRFDSDAVSVAVIMTDGVCRLDRHRPYAPGTLRLLPTGMLRSKAGKIVWLEAEHTCKRIRLYKGRGFNRIVVPDRFTVRMDDTVVDYCVPADILEKIAQIDGIELVVENRKV